MGKTLSAVINVVLLIGIISMMFMPISTVIALHTYPTDPDDPGDGSHCRGEPRSPWAHLSLELAGDIAPIIDDVENGGNGNGFVCVNVKSLRFQDDILPRR